MSQESKYLDARNLEQYEHYCRAVAAFKRQVVTVQMLRQYRACHIPRRIEMLAEFIGRAPREADGATVCEWVLMRVKTRPASNAWALTANDIAWGLVCIAEERAELCTLRTLVDMIEARVKPVRPEVQELLTQGIAYARRFYERAYTDVDELLLDALTLCDATDSHVGEVNLWLYELTGADRIAIECAEFLAHAVLSEGLRRHVPWQGRTPRGEQLTPARMRAMDVVNKYRDIEAGHAWLIYARLIRFVEATYPGSLGDGAWELGTEKEQFVFRDMLVDMWNKAGEAAIFQWFREEAARGHT